MRRQATQGYAVLMFPPRPEGAPQPKLGKARRRFAPKLDLSGSNRGVRVFRQPPRGAARRENCTALPGDGSAALGGAPIWALVPGRPGPRVN
jgi:hypothetical protein